MVKLFGQKWFRQIFRRRVFVILLLLLQLCVLVYFILSGSFLSRRFSNLLTLISLFVALYVVSKKEKGAFKLTWVFLILLFPLFGGAMYLLFNFQTSTKRFSNRIALIKDRTKHYYFLPGDRYDVTQKHIPNHIPQIRYLQKYAGFPIYTNSNTRYLTPGEQKFEVLKAELEKAEKYIFLEYFIIQEGVMWDEIFEILKRKVQEGVTVRLIYDDMGCFLVLPKNFSEKMKKPE